MQVRGMLLILFASSVVACGDDGGSPSNNDGSVASDGGGSGAIDASPGDARPIDAAPTIVGEPPELAGITNLHNTVRAMVDTQTPLPALAWSDALEATAKAYGEMCINMDGTPNIMDHNPNRSQGPPLSGRREHLRVERNGDSAGCGAVVGRGESELCLSKRLLAIDRPLHADRVAHDARGGMRARELPQHSVPEHDHLQLRTGRKQRRRAVLMMRAFVLCALVACGPPLAGDDEPSEGEPAELAGIVDAHNAIRRQVQTSPALEDLVWDDSLAATARAWVAMCRDQDAPTGLIDHNPNRGKGVGENVFGASGAATPQQAVTSWGNEKNDYDYSTNTCSDVCGHYTQIVWRSTTRVGCAIGSCPTLTYGSTIVCNYSPAGNVGNEKPY